MDVVIALIYIKNKHITLFLILIDLLVGDPFCLGF